MRAPKTPSGRVRRGTKCVAEALVEWLGDFGPRRLREVRSSSLRRLLSAMSVNWLTTSASPRDVEQRPVEAAGVVLEDAEPRDLSGEASRASVARVAGGDAEQHDEATADRSDRLAVDRDRRLGDALDDCSHRAIFAAVKSGCRRPIVTERWKHLRIPGRLSASSSYATALVSKETLVEILDEQQDARGQRLTRASSRRDPRRARARVIGPGRRDSSPSSTSCRSSSSTLADIDLRVADCSTKTRPSRFSVIPISRRADGAYLLAVADPSTVVFSDELREILGSTLYFAVVGPDALADALAYVRSRPVVALLTAQSDDEADEAESDVLVPTAIPDADPAFPSGRAAAQLWPPLGALLVGEGLLSDDELERALAQQRLSTSQRLGEILVERGVVTPAHVARLVAEQYELQYVELSGARRRRLDRPPPARRPRAVRSAQSRSPDTRTVRSTS